MKTMRSMGSRWLLALLLAACAPGDADGQLVNGFDLAGAAVPAGTILTGTIRDGIRAIDEPRFEAAALASKPEDGDRVLGLLHGGLAKAYPLDLLTHHEIVNDDFSEVNGAEGDGAASVAPVVVTYCPLCASGMAFVAAVAGRRLRFGVSGLLHNSDLLMFDRGSDSLWSQIRAQAITGAMKGTMLTPLPLIETTWKDWKKRHPESLVMTRDTGFLRHYDETLYPGYAESPQLWYPVEHRDDSVPLKDLVLGLEFDGEARAWPFSELQREAERQGVAQLELSATLAKHELVIRYDSEQHIAVARTAAAEPVQAMVSYWFAWHAFHPQGSVYRSAAVSVPVGAGEAGASGQ